MNVKKFFIVLTGCLVLLFCNSITTFAEITLPDGAVKGLPERLAALDDQGRAVNSATGEYFFRVENMQYGQIYSKSVQLMNLREDHAYYIYFYVEPLYRAGEINLEKGCECVFYLDGEEFYRGDVNGHGNIDLTEHYKNLGFYEPGGSHVLRAEVIWNNLDVLQNVDNGHRLVDKDGEHVLIGPDDEGYVEGEIEFKWIFFASVTEDDSSATETDSPTVVESKTTEITRDENSGGISVTETVTTTSASNDTPSETTPSRRTSGILTPFTGYQGKDGKFWIICMGIISFMIVILLILIRKKKQKKK
ncbi:MAG: hypothetical protein E7496_06825 [Ruminococcus sp.]|nr:hypothetical protein [Ruminococcus sp.]